MGVRAERAQALIEFALLVPVLLPITLGIVDYSRFMYYRQALTTAARAGVDMAINHCAGPNSCGMTDIPTTDDFVVQAAYCAAAPSVILRPVPSTCTACLTASCPSPCGATCLAAVCQGDICIDPSGTRANGEAVTVSVGYAFAPVTPFINVFFPLQSCWSGDPASNRHTLCASYSGTVS